MDRLILRDRDEQDYVKMLEVFMVDHTDKHKRFLDIYLLPVKRSL